MAPPASAAVRLSTVPEDFVARGRRIGLVVLATDRGVEADLHHIVPEGVSAYVSRATSYVGLDQAAASIAVREAASKLVPGLDLDVVGFACSSGSFLLDERLLTEALTVGREDVRAVTVKAAVLGEAARLGVRSVSLLTPYDFDLTNLIAFHLGASGLKTVRAGCFGLETDEETAGLSSSKIVEGGLSLDCSESDALVILCNALQTRSAVAELTRVLRKPVIASSQALVASCIRG